MQVCECASASASALEDRFLAQGVRASVQVRVRVTVGCVHVCVCASVRVRVRVTVGCVHV